MIDGRWAWAQEVRSRLPLRGSLWPPLGGPIWVTLPGSTWVTPGGSASPTPVAHYRATADSLHRIDENAAAEVAPVLAYLRDLERHFHTAVLLVHHARKGAAHARAGQALRGSSELHAWGDSNLYLRRRGDTLCLAIEHRAAPSRDGLVVELRAQGDALALHLVADGLSGERVLTPPAPALGERIEHALGEAATPLTRRALRRVCRLRASTLGPVLARLLADGRVTRSPAGYALVPS